MMGENFDNCTIEKLGAAIKNCTISTPFQPEIQDIQGNVIQPQILAIQAHPISAFVEGCLKVALLACNYYRKTGKNYEPSSMHFTNVLKDFYVEYQSIQNLSEKDEENTPVIDKRLPIMHWTEVWKNHLMETFGAREIPFFYVIRPSVDVPPEVREPLLYNNAYSETHGSIMQEKIHRFSATMIHCSRPIMNK